MTEYREKLIDKMIQVYGYEHPLVIAFAGMCEACHSGAYEDSLLETIAKIHTEK